MSSEREMTDHNREEREALIRAVQAVTWNASNYPTKVQPHILGQDVVPLTLKIVDAVQAVFEQAHTPADEEMRAEVERVQKAAWAEVHGQDPMRKYSVGEVKRLVYSFDNLLGSLLTCRTVQGKPADAQVEYRARAAAGHVYGDARITPGLAVAAYEEALGRETFEQDDETPVVEMRSVGPWLPVERGDAS